MAAGLLPARQEDGSHDQRYCTQTGASEASPNGHEITDTRDSENSMGKRLDVQRHGRKVYELTPTPTKKVLRVHQGLHRALSTAIIQLRKGKIGLRHYLYQRGVPNIPDADCQCGKATQTVQHVLLACPLFKSLREEIFGRRLGGPEGEGSLKKILNTPKLAIQQPNL
jgi:hypothetical protein